MNSSHSTLNNTQSTLNSTVRDFDCYLMTTTVTTTTTTTTATTTINSLRTIADGQLVLDCDSPKLEESIPQFVNSLSDSDGLGSQNCLLDAVNSSTSPEDQLHQLTDEGSYIMKPETRIGSPLGHYTINSNLDNHTTDHLKSSQDLNYFNRYGNFTSSLSSSSSSSPSSSSSSSSTTTAATATTKVGPVFVSDTHVTNYLNLDFTSTPDHHTTIHDANPNLCTQKISNPISDLTMNATHDNFAHDSKMNPIFSNYRLFTDNEHSCTSYFASTTTTTMMTTTATTTTSSLSSTSPFPFVQTLNSKSIESDSTYLHSTLLHNRLQSINPMYKLPISLPESQDLNFDQFPDPINSSASSSGLGIHRSGRISGSQSNQLMIGLDACFPSNHLNSHPVRLSSSSTSSSSPVQPVLPYMKQLTDPTENSNPIKHLTWGPTPNAFNYRSHTGHPAEFNSARRRNATKESTATLKAWLQEHIKNPYPTKGEKIMLAIITKMTLTQVSTWFANARRRLKKENKMTWTPKHRGEETAEDDDDDEDEDETQSDDECQMNEEPNRLDTDHAGMDKESYGRKHFTNYDCKLDGFESDLNDMKSELLVKHRLHRSGKSNYPLESETIEPGSYREPVCSPLLSADSKSVNSLRMPNSFNPTMGPDMMPDHLSHTHQNTTHTNLSSLGHFTKKSWDMESFGNFNRNLQNHFVQDADSDLTRMRRSFKDEFGEKQRKIATLQADKMSSCANQLDWPNSNHSESTLSPFLKPDQMALHLRSSYLNNCNLNFPPPYKQETFPLQLTQPFDLNRPTHFYDTILPNPNQTIQPNCSTPHTFYNPLCGLSNPVNLFPNSYRPSISNLLINSMEFSNQDCSKLSPTQTMSHDNMSNQSFNSTTTTTNTNTTGTGNSTTNTTISSIEIQNESNPISLKTNHTSNSLSSWFFPIQTRPEDISSDPNPVDHHTNLFHSVTNSSSSSTVVFNISPQTSLDPDLNSDDMVQWPTSTTIPGHSNSLIKSCDHLVKSIYERSEDDITLHSFYLPNYSSIDYTSGTQETQLPLSS